MARFRIASTPRYRDSKTGEWKDGEALFLTCQAWRQAAEDVAESLRRGAGRRQGNGKDADPWASEASGGFSDEPPF